MKIIQFFLLSLLLCCCETSSNKENKPLEKDCNTTCDFFFSDLKVIVESFSDTLCSQHINDSIQQKEYITVVFWILDKDTLVNIENERVPGVFIIGSPIDWRFSHQLGDNEVVIGDLENNLGAKFYDYKKLKPFKRQETSSVIDDTGGFYDYPTISWDYLLRNGRIVKQ